MNKRYYTNMLVTGGSGFIGTNFIRYLLEESETFDGRIINFDALTYAANPTNLADLEERMPDRYAFVHGDIRSGEDIARVLSEYQVDAVVHFAAESHVDRSIHGPGEFVTTNVNGTFALLEAVRATWKDGDDVLFHHVSTDEVFGSLGATGKFHEHTPYDPRSPYSASKAASDHLVRAYHHTYGIPITVTNCSNNYGPYQFPEKLIPLMVLNMLDGKPLPIYGDGSNVRDWLYVGDHARAVWTVMQSGTIGGSYNVGGDTELPNLTLVETLCDVVARHTDPEPADYRNLIQFVTDRPGHDRRYAIDCTRIKQELGWTQTVSFEEGLDRTVRWYLEHPEWIDAVKSGEYRKWIDENYAKR